MPTEYCENCGIELPNNGYPCDECGHQPDPRAVSTSNKSPVLGFVLSFIVWGLGQVYAGRVARALGWFVGGFILFSILFNLGPLVILAFLIPFVSGYDAYRVIVRENSADADPSDRYECQLCGSEFILTKSVQSPECPDCGGPGVRYDRLHNKK